MDDYEAAFGSREISGFVKTMSDDSRDKFFQGVFQRGQYMTPWDPNHIEWDDERLSRGLAPVTGLESPSPSTKLNKRLVKHMSAIKVTEHAFIPAHRLFYQRVGGSLLPSAQDVIDLQAENLRKRVFRTVEKVCADSLLGEVLVNTSTYPGSTILDDIVWPVKKLSSVADWSTSTTLISSKELPALVTAYRKNVNRIPGLAIVNADTEQFILQNGEVQNLGKQPLQQANMILTAKLGEDDVLNALRLGGLTWHKHLGTWAAGDGDPLAGDTVNEFMPDNTVIVLPPEGELADVLAFAECSAIVPSQLWGDMRTVGLDRMPPGFAAYTEVSSDPVGIKIIVVWIGAPILKFPEADLVYTTHP